MTTLVNPYFFSAPAASVFKSGAYIGTGTSSQQVTLGFEADYIWIRPSGGIGPVRGFIPGVTTSYCAMGDQNGLWVAATGNNGITSNATGFVAQTDINQNGATYIYLAWKSSTGMYQRINWTGNGSSGRLISHTMGVQPDMVFNQRTFSGSGSTGDILTSQPVIKGTLGSIQIQDFGIAGNNKFSTSLNAGLYNNTAVSSTDLSVGTYLNSNAALYYAYMWKSSVGACKVGLYTGNGGTNGTAIDVGFVASAVVINRCDATANGQLPTVWVGSYNWNKYFTLPGSTINDAANGIVISGNTFAPPGTDNVNGVIYSYMAFK